MAEHVCPPWLSFLLINSFRSWAQNPRKILRPYVKRGEMALDAGCGPGFFTIAMAGLVGEEGLVIAADIHAEMLERVRRRAEKAGVMSRIRLHLGQKDRLGIKDKVDFALAFWTVHEVRDQDRFFNEIRSSMKPNATFLLVEPKLHVPENIFKGMVETALKAGLFPWSEEKISLSRAVLFKCS
jgi:ubiquinone/menaquinone biosynthesis C-methylase UbiE